MDEHGYSILMGIFSLAILLYAGLMALTKNYKLLPARASVSVKPKNPKKYMTQLAKAVALAALAPGLSALAALWNMTAALIVLFAALILFLWLGTKFMKGVE